MYSQYMQNGENWRDVFRGWGLTFFYPLFTGNFKFSHNFFSGTFFLTELNKRGNCIRHMLSLSLFLLAIAHGTVEYV